MRRTLFVLAGILGLSAMAEAQPYVSAGVGLTVVSVPASGDIGTPLSGGEDLGAAGQFTVGAGVFVVPRFALGVEFVIPGDVSFQQRASRTIVTETARDVIIAGIARYKVVNALEVVFGASVVSQHFDLNGDSPGFYTGGAVVGLDCPATINKHVAILGSLRLQLISRSFASTYGSVLFQPSVVLRFSR